MGAIQRRHSLILVAIMVLAAFVPSISPYDIEDPILEDEEPIMETGTGPEMAFNLNQAMSIGSSNIDRVHDMASGPNGSVYFIGEFQGTISFGGYNLTSSGSYFDVYVAKLKNNGQWGWIAKISGSSTDRGYGIAVDGGGNAYVTGSCYNTCYFSEGGQNQGNITSQGSADLYVAMIKNSGQWEWMASAGTSGGSEQGIDIAVDASGNSYVTGYVRNGTVFKDADGGGTTTVYTENGKEILAAKLDSSGDWKWVETAGGMGDDVGASIDIDSSGNAYITGFFTNDSAFGSSITLSQFSSEEMFVAKIGFGATGELSWSWAVPFTGWGATKGTSIEIGPTGNVFATGIFTSNITVGTTNHGVTSGTIATAVTKLNQSNGQILWYNSASGSDVQAKDLLLSDTEIILTGNHKSTSYFGNYDIIGSSSANDGFIAALNPSNGTWNWSERIESGSGEVQMNNIEMSPDGSLDVAGYFTGTINLLGTNFSAPNNNHDIFLANIIYAKEGCYVDGTNYNNASQWSICSGGSSSVVIEDVTTDSAGNFYMTGYFTGTAIIWGEILVSSGSNDIFIAKLNNNEAWAVKAGGSDYDVGRGIAVDSSGNAYATGFFYGTATFGSTSLTSSGSNEIFVAKLSSSGSWQWAVKAGGSSNDNGNGIAVDSSGNAYVTGTFQGTATFGNTNLTSSGSYDIFIAKLSSSGSWQWAVKAGGSSDDRGNGITVHPSGTSYATGFFVGTATFGSGSLTSSGGTDIFIAKLSSSGSWQWAVKAGGSSSDSGTGIAVHSSGNAYATGFFDGTATFGSTSLTSSGGIDIFVAKLSPSGSWQWAVKAGGSSYDYGYGIAVDSSGNAYATGSFIGTATFGGTSLTSSGNDDIFIAKLSSSGSWQWAVKAGGLSDEYGYGIAVDSSGNSYAVGKFSTTATFGPQSLSCGANVYCGFLWKVDTPAAPPSTPPGSINASLWWNSTTSKLNGSFTAQSLMTNGNYTVIYELQYTSNNTVITNNTENWVASISTSQLFFNWDMYIHGLNYGEQYTLNASLYFMYAFGGPLLDSVESDVTIPNLPPTNIFNSTTDWTSSNSPDTFSVAWGDVDGDGDLDLAVGNYGGNNEIYLNSGTALATTPAWTSSNSLETKSVAWGDVDGDGDLDLAVGNAFQNNEIYLNSGTALATTPAWTSSNSLDTLSVAWGDVDGDGDLDLAVGNFDGNNEIYLNSGTALATTPAWTSSNSLDTYSAAWGDVDGDGDLDLAVGNYDDNNEVYLNSGTALATTPAWTSSNSLKTRSVTWGDVDGDGDLDLAVGNTGGNEVYLNQLDDGGAGADGLPDIDLGSLQSIFNSTTDWTSSNGLYTRSVAWGDVDGDGDLDLAVGNYGDNNEVYLNSGSALATTPAWTSSNSLSTMSVAWGDVDGDGDLDLAVGNDGGNNEVYLNDGTALATTPAWTSSNSLNTLSVAWGDVDGDGDLDLAVGNYDDNNEVYLNSGTALATTPAWTSSNSLKTRSVTWGDVDGDGDLDLAVGNYGNNEVYLNSGSALATTPDWTSSNSLNTRSVAWGDVDGDGDLDLAVGNNVQNNEVYLNQLDDGGAGADGLPDIDLGGLQSIFNSTTDWTSSNSLSTWSVAWGDVDGDGDLDLAVGNNGGNNEVYLNDGTALATTPSWTSSNSLDTLSVAWGDVDGDGDLDLAVGNYGDNNEVYLNSGTALATTPAWTSSNSLGTFSIVWGDVDGDGDLDLAVGNDGGNEYNEIYLNDGTALATTPAWTSSNSLNTMSVAWGDVDGDGDLDLAVGNDGGNNEIYLNDGTALATTPAWTSSNSLNTMSVAWGDVDGDGDLDLAVGNDDGNNEVYLNDGTALATTPAWTSSNSPDTLSVAWGDVDGDGDLDLAVGNYGGNNEVYLNDGTTLTSTPAWTSSNSLYTRSVAWGDVDGDGDLDLAVGNDGGNTEVYLNQLDDGGAGADGLPDGSNYAGNEWYEVGSGITIDETNDSWSAWINVSSMPTNIDFDITYSVELAYDSVSLAIFNDTLEDESWDGTETNHIISSKTLSENVMSIAGRYNEYCLDYDIYHSITGALASGGSYCYGYTPPISNDGDWIPDSYEGAFTQTSSSLLDTDGDGWGDWIEHWGGSDPSDEFDTPTDADNDGLPYLLEEMMGTSDNDNDSDGDGALDFDDFRYGGHPARASYIPPNNDWDSCWDNWEDQVGLNSSNPDSDGDGVYDCFESDPWNASSSPTDTDGDGLPDDLESLYNTNLSNPDSDGDGVPDSAEIGSGTNPNDVLNYNVNYWSNFGQTLEQFGTVTASTTATIYSANNVLDDNHLSYWQPENPCPGWIEIDLGNVYRPSYIEVSIFNEDYDDDYPREFVIQTRETPSDNWSNVSSFTFNDNMGLTGAFGGYTELHKVRYVRIYCISSNDNLEVPHDIAFSEITIYDSTNLQYVNLSAIDNQTTGGTGGTNSEIAWASLNVDGENQTASGSYTVSGLQNEVQYYLEWRFTNSSSSFCDDDWISTFSDGNLPFTGSPEVNGAGPVNLNIDYFTVIDWSGFFCLELELYSSGDDALIATSQSWWYIDTVPGGQNNTDPGGQNNTDNNTNTDADGDGVNNLFDLCPNTSAGAEVDGDGCEIVETHNPVLDVIFDERQESKVWYQEITVSISDIWLNQNYSMSLKVVDSNGNTVYSYFSPMDEDDQNGWWRFGNEMVEDPTEQYIDLNWDGLLTSGEWEGSSRFFDEIEYPFFGDGEYCVEISLGHQINSNDGPMDVINNIFDNEEVCGEFLHESMEGVVWDGQEEVELSTLDKVMANKIVSSLLDFMDSTQGQILSICLAILGFAGKMVLARGQRAKNKRVTKFSNAIRKAESRGRLKILEMDIEKANEKGRLPRGGFGDLMEQIESRMESLGFDDDPDQGSTSGNWTSGDEMQQESEVVWNAQDMMGAQDMMEDAREEVKMTRQAVEDLQDRLNIDTRYAEEPVSKGPRYERSGVRLSDSASSTGPSLPGSKDGGLEAKPDLVASILSQNIAPKDKCPCGNGKMYKDCHMKKGKKKKKW